MVLGFRSSEKREKERELEGAYLNSHRTPDKTGEILQKYSRFNRLTLAPRHINYCSINTGG
jgi:hypothetical protein